ncbi:MAG: hypothetical protein ABSG86_16200 [Thermoguttaceae bacterium]|jgi:hypothetical protein
MRQSISRSQAWIVVALALGAWILSASPAPGQFPGRGGGGGKHGDGGRHSQDDAQEQALKPPPALVVLTPHGGEYIATKANRYEIVYMPLQTRIYLYDAKLKPLSARDVHAQMVVQLPGDAAPRRIGLGYVAMPPGVAQQDYVAAAFDIRPLQGKEATITFEFSGLPDPRHATASFTPCYASFSTRPYVATVLLTQADRDGLARQPICPVSGVPLGSRGPIVKLYVGDCPLYVSGEDCIRAVKEAPDRYLAQRPPPIVNR